MPKIDSEKNIVEALRSKTEELDIKQYLKSTMGGYTKNSVLEYVNMLRRQQQSMAETFSYNQQTLFDEKENLKKANEVLKNHVAQVEAEYQELSKSLRINELENEDFSVSDVIALKSKISALEEDLNKGEIEKSHLEMQLEQQKSISEDTSFKLKQSEQEKLSIKEILKGEMSKSKELNLVISRLSGKIQEKDDEVVFLNSLVSEGQLAKLTEKVTELTEQLSSQAEVLVAYNHEGGLKSRMLEALNQENDALKKRNGDLSKNIDELKYQNCKYLAANSALTEQLENEYKKTIALIKEKSSVIMDKLTATGKLDEANSKIVMLELRLKKQSESEETEAVYKGLIQTEKI